MNKYLELMYYLTIKKNVILLRKLGRKIDEKRFVAFLIFIAVVVALLCYILLIVNLRSLILFVFLYVGTALYLPQILYENKIERLERNIPKALYVMILSLESGRSVNEALEEVVKSNIKEVSSIFRKVLYLMEKQKLSFEESINIVSNLYDSKILRMLARIMIENRKYGGNLSDSLKILAKTLEDFELYKRQLLSVTGTGLAVGFIILCGVIPAVAGLLGAYLISVSTLMSGISAPLPPVTPEDIAKGLEIVQIGSAIIGALFAIPLFGLNLGRMFLISTLTSTISVLTYYAILKVAPGFFT
ncbi:type II secretion system F family protein [Methanocaldococcus sp. 28A]